MILGEQGDFGKEYSPQEVPKLISPFITLIAVQEFVLGRQKKNVRPDTLEAIFNVLVAGANR